MDDTTKARSMSKSPHFPAVAGALAGLLTAALGAWHLYPQHIGPGGTPRPAVAAPAATTPGTSAAASPAAPRPQRQALDREQAVARLMALPELQAWAAQIERASGGAVHGAVVPFDPALRTVDGRPYHQLSFVENRPDATVTWESFLVGATDGAILVDGDAGLLPLERWRREKRPLARTAR